MKPGRAHLLLASLAAVAASLVALLLAVQHRAGQRPPAAEPAATGAAGSLRDDPLVVLRAWDERRAEAWAAGDVAALRALYLPGSATGRHDAHLLDRYLARGLRVRGMGVQVLAVDVRRAGDDVLRLVVTDRLVGAVATGAGVRTALPADAPSRRLVTLRLVGSRWRVDEVRDY